MLLKFSEQTIDDFHIPSFTLARGEIVIIYFHSGALFRPMVSQMAALFTGKITGCGLQIASPFHFVEYHEQNTMMARFFPVTIEAYYRKYANPSNTTYRKLFDDKFVNPKLPVKELTRSMIKQLSLYTTLSWNTNIIFDLVAIDPVGGVEIYGLVKTMVKSGGAAILIDQCDEFKSECTTYIETKYLG